MLSCEFKSKISKRKQQTSIWNKTKSRIMPSRVRNKIIDGVVQRLFKPTSGISKLNWKPIAPIKAVFWLFSWFYRWICKPQWIQAKFKYMKLKQRDIVGSLQSNISTRKSSKNWDVSFIILNKEYRKMKLYITRKRGLQLRRNQIQQYLKLQQKFSQVNWSRCWKTKQWEILIR